MLLHGSHTPSPMIRKQSYNVLKSIPLVNWSLSLAPFFWPCKFWKSETFDNNHHWKCAYLEILKVQGTHYACFLSLMAHASSHDVWDGLLLWPSHGACFLTWCLGWTPPSTSALCLKQSFLGMFPQVIEEKKPLHTTFFELP